MLKTSACLVFCASILSPTAVVAADVPLPLGGAGKQGTFARAGEIDSYLLKLPDKNQAYAVLFRGSIEYPGNGSVRIYTNKGEQLAVGGCDWDDPNCLAAFRAPYAGNYRVRVTQNGGPTRYVVKAAKDCADDIRTICTLKLGQVTKGDAFSDHDIDWWSVSLKAGAAYDIVSKAAIDYSNSDARLTIHGPSGQLLRYGYGTGADGLSQSKIANFRPSKTATYFVSYYAFYNASGPYTLKVALRKP